MIVYTGYKDGTKVLQLRYRSQNISIKVKQRSNDIDSQRKGQAMKKQTFGKVIKIFLSILFCVRIMASDVAVAAPVSTTVWGGNGETVQLEMKKQSGYYLLTFTETQIGHLQIQYARENDYNYYAIVLNWDHTQLMDQAGQPIPGSTFNSSYEETLGAYITNVSIPEAYFGDSVASIAGVPIGDITATEENSGNAETKPEETKPEETKPEEVVPNPPVGVYQGITIDGQFGDWDSVTKTAVTQGILDYTAMIWDGDFIYLYFGFGGDNPGAITWSGPYSNGKFRIGNDLGEDIYFQLQMNDSGPVVYGVDGASIALNSAAWAGGPFQWELSIPASNLPEGSSSLSMGYVGEEPIITNVGNLQGTPEKPQQSELVYDGKFDDWKYFPKTIIQYTGPGTGEYNPDASGALAIAGNTFMGYVQTTMPAHLSECGGEFTEDTIFRINDVYDFGPQFVAVDGDGTIHYDAQTRNLPQGTYEFYLIDRGGWKTATNISQWSDPNDLCYGTNAVYGKAMISIGASMDQMEYILYPEAFAAKFGLDKNEISTFAVKHERLGSQWVYAAGASSGPLAGVLLCVTTSGLVLYRRKQKEKGKGQR